jgi:hypothetical protein
MPDIKPQAVGNRRNFVSSVVRLGGAIANKYQGYRDQLAKAEYNNQMLNAQVATLSAFDDYTRQMEFDRDYLTQGARWDNFAKQTMSKVSEQITNGEAKSAYEAWAALKAIEKGDTVKDLAQRNHIDVLITDSQSRIDAAVENVWPEQLQTEIESLRASQLLSSAAVDAIADTAYHGINVNIVRKALNDMAPEDAYEWISSQSAIEGLKDTDKTALENEQYQRWNHAEYFGGKQADEQMNDWYSDAYDDIIAGEVQSMSQLYDEKYGELNTDAKRMESLRGIMKSIATAAEEKRRVKKENLKREIEQAASTKREQNKLTTWSEIDNAADVDSLEELEDKVNSASQGYYDEPGQSGRRDALLRLIDSRRQRMLSDEDQETDEEKEQRLAKDELWETKYLAIRDAGSQDELKNLRSQIDELDFDTMALQDKKTLYSEIEAREKEIEVEIEEPKDPMTYADPILVSDLVTMWVNRDEHVNDRQSYAEKMKTYVEGKMGHGIPLQGEHAAKKWIDNIDNWARGEDPDDPAVASIKKNSDQWVNSTYGSFETIYEYKGDFQMITVIGQERFRLKNLLDTMYETEQFKNADQVTREEMAENTIKKFFENSDVKDQWFKEILAAETIEDVEGQWETGFFTPNPARYHQRKQTILFDMMKTNNKMQRRDRVDFDNLRYVYSKEDETQERIMDMTNRKVWRYNDEEGKWYYHEFDERGTLIGEWEKF